MADELGLKVYDVVTVTGGLTELFNIPDASDIYEFRIWVKNLGAAAFTDAELQGSFDGVLWQDIDNTVVLNLFGTLAGGAAASVAESGMFWPYLRFRANCGTTTTAQAQITIGRKGYI